MSVCEGEWVPVNEMWGRTSADTEMLSVRGPAPSAVVSSSLGTAQWYVAGSNVTPTIA